MLAIIFSLVVLAVVLYIVRLLLSSIVELPSNLTTAVLVVIALVWILRLFGVL